MCSIMSERFVVFVESKDTCQLYDEETHCFYEIHDSARNVDILCERLNGLVEENERLKQKLENLSLNAKNDMVKMIDGKFFIRM